MTTFDAWHLPGLEVGETGTIEVGALRCRYPVPDRTLIASAARALRTAGRALREMPVARIVDVVDEAAARLADGRDPLREMAEEALGAATGYSPAMTRLVLDRMAADWRADRLRPLLAAELPDPEVLDGFRPLGPGRAGRAYGPELAFQVFAGNVPGVAVTAMVRALLVKAPTLGKLAADEPVLPVLFARAVREADTDVGRALGVTYWPGGTEAAEAPALEAADAVVVYGGEEVARSYRTRLSGERRLVVHGPRFSVGLVGRDALTGDLAPLAGNIARAVAAFDQHGCVSPHAVWVEEGGDASPLELARALAHALEETEAALPRGRISAGEASAIQQERAAAELRGHAADRPATRVFSGAGTRWTVIYDPEPAFRPSCLNRLVRVHPVGTLGEAVAVLAPAGRFLQSVALAADDRPGLAHQLARIGATRVTTFQRLPWPPPEWHHDGAGPLRELLRWVDLER